MTYAIDNEMCDDTTEFKKTKRYTRLKTDADREKYGNIIMIIIMTMMMMMLVIVSIMD